jgi:peptidoglycan hydrolase CwlO-like protein
MTDKEFWDMGTKVFMWITGCWAFVMSARAVSREFGGRMKSIEELKKDVIIINKDFEKLRSDCEDGNSDREQLKRSIDKCERDIESLLDKFLNRVKTQRYR